MNRMPIVLIFALLIAAGYGAFAPAVDTRLPQIIAPPNGTANTNTPTVTLTVAGAATGTSTSTGTATSTSTVTPTPTNTATSTTTGTATNTPTQTSTATATGTATDTPTATATATATTPPQGPCPCNADVRNCSDFATHTQAQACFDFCVSQGAGDIHKLDQDGDGDACESLPGLFRVIR
jgi:hypothetical protein